MDPKSAEEIVLQGLTHFTRRDDIIYEVAEAMGWQWDVAKKFVEDIEASTEHIVTKRREPILYVIHLAMLVGGVVLMIAMVGFALAGISIIRIGIPLPFSGNVLLFLTGLPIAIRGGLGLIKLLKRRVV